MADNPQSDVHGGHPAGRDDMRGGMLAQAGIIALIGVVLALTGAFGTADIPFGWRLIYWVGGLLAALGMLKVLVLVTRQSAALAGLPPVTAYLLAIPLLAAIIVLALGASGFGMGSVTPALFLQSAGLGAAIFGLFFVLNLRKPQSVEEAGSKPITNVPDAAFKQLTDTALHARLPRGFGPISAFGVEDHYTIVLGLDRREMLLISLADAIAGVGEGAGLQVHRSWWVAHGAVRNVHREGRNMVLELEGGTRVPVSRANVAAVRGAGWV